MSAADTASLELDADARAALDWIDGEADARADEVKAWSRINSGSRNDAGLRAMLEVLPTAFARLEARIDRVDLPPSEVVGADGTVRPVEHPPSLRVTQRPAAPIQIVLTGHYDTVFPVDSAFQDWRMLDADTINGPGVADMKGGVLVMATALAALERHPKAGDVGYTVFLSPDEEIGSPASGAAITELGRTAHAGMTYEPALADGGLAGARKGSGNFSLVVRGRAAHAGREHHLGRNALEAVAGFVVGLQALNGRRDGVTFNAAKIDGGGPSNVVPDLGVCRFNVRLGRPEDADWITAEVAKLVADVNRRDGVTATLHGGFTRPPKPMAPPNARLFAYTRAAGAALGIDVFWSDTGGVCEGNNLWAAGCPNVDTLGVRGGQIHSADEFAILSSLPERAKLSAAMLMGYASGAFDVRGLRTS